MPYVEHLELHRLLQQALSSQLTRGTFVAFADNRFWTPTRDELVRLVSDVDFPDIDAIATVGEAFDCDDYAFVLKGRASNSNRRRGVSSGLCLGIAWGRFSWLPGIDHAVNWVVEDDRSFWWIEPQTRRFHRPEECLGSLSLLIA